MRFSNSKEGFSFLESFANFEKTGSDAARTFRLDRMETLLKAFGNPQHSFRSLHLAGSKGKGSTSAFLASLLSQAGYKTGLYTSPHVTTYKERITLAGREFPEELYTYWLNQIAASIQGLRLPGGEEPTTFELLTLLAFLIFQEEGVEWGVIETGLGGRLDATNLVVPQACIFTPVELEHTDVLGNTLALIAGEKAGIIKKGVPVFSSSQKTEAREVFKKRSRDLESSCLFFEDSGYSVKSELTLTGTDLEIQRRGKPPVRSRLSLLGRFQGENAALAVLVLEHLSRQGVVREMSPEVLSKGLSNARLPGRMELILEKPPVLLDGAHTPVSAALVNKTFTELFPKDRILIFGSVAGKDFASMASLLSPWFSQIIVTTPGSFKKSDPEQVFKSFKAFKEDTLFIPEPLKAAERALELSNGITPILVTGSFYLVGELRPFFISLEEK